MNRVLGYGISFMLVGIVWMFDLLPKHKNSKLILGNSDEAFYAGLFLLIMGFIFVLSETKKIKKNKKGRSPK